MTTEARTNKKFYAMRRMREAIDRAIDANTIPKKERAARWAAAWGRAAGIPFFAQAARPTRTR